MAASNFDFSHFFVYAEIVQFLQQIAEHYPKLIQLQVIGQSHEKRDIWLATLTNQASGSATEKPGYWIDANIHAGEVTGSVVALYTIHRLLTAYGQDPQITALLDGYTLYVVPRISVDGAEKYLTTPYLLRSGTRPYPFAEKQDGLHPEDIDGDGKILDMRLPDPCGAWKISEKDPRIMVRRDPAEFGGSYYTLLPEGMIENYNGCDFLLAPALEGLDFNRNFAHEWVPENEQQGAGDFPFSEPEIRALAEFWQTHRNINGFVTYHTYSAVHIRSYATHPDDYFPREDLDIIKLIGQQATEITGYPTISGYHQFRYHPKKVSHGNLNTYGYDHWGWFGFTTELWDLPTEAGIQKTDYIQWFRWHPEEDDLTMLRWNDEKLSGRGFIPWRPYQHPQLGSVEIGGWDYKQVWQNAPAEWLPDLCDKHCRFTIAHALMSPRLAIAKSQVDAISATLYRLSVQIENQGFLPTYTSKKALERQIAGSIKITLILPDSATLIGGSAKQDIGHLEGRSNKAFADITNRDGFGVDNKRKIEWLIEAKPGDMVAIQACSDRAGSVRQSLLLTKS